MPEPKHPGAGAAREALIEWRHAILRQRAAQDRKGEARRAVQEAFARSRGWRVARQDFTLRQLREGIHGRMRVDDYTDAADSGAIDHAEYYRDGGRPSRPVAILSHTYQSLDQVLKYAAAKGLAVEVLPFKSWYFPGHRLPVLFTREVQS
jgi:hypothetical protein